jgi:hypothetical protein
MDLILWEVIFKKNPGLVKYVLFAVPDRTGPVNFDDTDLSYPKVNGNWPMYQLIRVYSVDIVIMNVI